MQKLISLLIASFIFAQFTQAQTCKNDLFPYQKGLKYSYESYDKKGKLSAISDSEVLAIQSLGDSVKAEIKSVTKDHKGKEIATGTMVSTCVKGVLLLDIRSLMAGNPAANGIKDADVLISGKPLEYPHALSVGQSLPDGDLTMIFNMNGLQIMKMAFTITNRKVAAKESITVKAGTYDAYKITCDMKMDVMFVRQVTMEQWMAPGVGMVKSVTKDKNGNMDSYMELASFKK